MGRTSDAWLGAITLVAIGLVAVAGLLMLRGTANDTNASDSRGSPTPWSRLALEDEQTMRVSYESSPCQESSDVVVDEDADHIVVTVHTQVATGMCVSTAVRYDATVELDSPRGERPVYDGACLEQSAKDLDQSCRRRPT